MRRIFMLFFATLALTNLSACSNAKKMLGLTRSAPDEFTVLTRAPLTLPPSFDLKPPKKGSVRPQEGTSSQKAKQSLFNEEPQNIYSKEFLYEAKEGNKKTDGEISLLQKANVEKAIPNIKKILNSENEKLVDSPKEFTDKILFWNDNKQNSTVIIDTEKEAKRIQENNALGKPITSGDTPVIEKNSKGFLEKIFKK